MKIKKEFIGQQVLVPQLGIFVTIGEREPQYYVKLGLFHVIEKDEPRISIKPAKQSRRNSKRPTDRA